LAKTTIAKKKNKKATGTTLFGHYHRLKNWVRISQMKTKTAWKAPAFHAMTWKASNFRVRPESPNCLHFPVVWPRRNDQSCSHWILQQATLMMLKIKSIWY
jgi:hypothetical protein